MAREPGWREDRRGGRGTRTTPSNTGSSPGAKSSIDALKNRNKPNPKNTITRAGQSDWSSSPAAVLRRDNASDSSLRSSARWSPQQASEPTRRYLEKAGGIEPYRNEQPRLPEFETDQSTLRALEDHSYKLTPWQMEQAELDYGIRAPDESPLLFGSHWQTGSVTREAWDRMSPQQQNALRFNDELFRSVELDRKLDSTEMSDDYRNEVAEMFGTQGGSEMYAPNTLALLQGLGMDRLRGQDLDEYLSFDRAYDTQEVAALQPWDETPVLDKYEGFGQARSVDQAGVLDRLQIDKAGQLIEQAMASPDVYGWDQRSRIDQFLGRALDPQSVPIGWLFGDETPGDSRTDEDSQNREFFFQAAYDYLSSDAAAGEPGGLDFMWQQGDENGFTDADYDQLFDYFYLRSLEDDRVGAGDGRRSGADIRAILGMGD
jgi:hypothetical protein